MRFGSTVARSLVLVLLVLVVVGGCSQLSGESLSTVFLDSDHASSPINSLAGWVSVALEAVGIIVIVLGAAVATAYFIYRTLRGAFSMHLYHRYREQLGEVILLGLEFLVAADIVGTVSVALNLENVIALAAIILVRTFLSFTLEVETTGYWPWQRGGQSRVGVRERVRQSDSEAADTRRQDG